MSVRHVNRVLLTTAAAGAVAAVGATVVASPAGAATKRVLPADIDKLPRGGAIEYGTATIKVSGGAASKLKSAGTKLSGTGEAEVKGNTISIEALTDSGPLDVTQMEGWVGVDGGLTAKGKKGSAKISAIVFQPGLSNKNVVAKVGKKLVELGALTGGKATFSKQADGLLKGAKLSLTKSGAKALNAAAGGGFSAGSFGTVDLQFTTRELPIKEGVAKLTLAPGLLDTLTQNGLDITAEAPAVRNGNEVTIRLAAGAFDPEANTGRLQLEGKVTVGKTGTSVNLFGWRAAIGTSQKELFAQINDSIAAPVANIDVSALAANFEGEDFRATGGKLKLSEIASNTIKSQFGIVVATGTDMGTVELTGRLSGRQ